MSDFCGPEGFGPFAPKDLRIDFTPCFEEVIIFLFAKVILIFCGILRLISIWNKPAPSQAGFSLVFWSKNLLTFGLLIAYIVELALRIVDWDESYGYELLSPFFSVAAALVALILQAREHYRVKRTSPVLLLSWLGITIYYGFRLNTLIQMNVTEDLYFILFCVQMGLVVSVFFLANLSLDKGPYQRIGEETECPESYANYFSVLTFQWINPLMVLGYKKPLSMSDLWPLNVSDDTTKISKQFEEAWEKELAKPKPSFIRALAFSLGGPFFVAGFFKLGQDLLAFVQPMLLEKLIEFIDSSCGGCETEQPIYRGYLIAVGMFCTAVIQTILLHQYFHRCFVTGMRFRAAIVTAVYRKAFLLSNDSRQKSSVGEIVNHMAIDAQRLMDLCGYLHVLWSGPVQIVLALYLLYGVLGPAVFAGLFVMVSLIPLNAWLANKMKNYQQTQMKNKDTRIKLMDEILSGIKVIKLYAWESPFIDKVSDVRQKEMNTLKTVAYIASIQTFTWTCAPFLVSIVSFIFYIIIEKQPLTSDTAFVSLSLFNLLQFPLTMLPSVITSSVEASVAVNRLYKYLTSDELNGENVLRLGSSNPSQSAPKGMDPDCRILVRDGSFKWAKDAPKETLQNINLKIGSKSLVAIVGSVGAGKSSICSALLGNMTKTNGSVTLRGKVAYVSQQSWIMNATLKENILFGLAENTALYQATLAACALLPDIEMLPAGDQTEIGEKGINLSGGQKQRVSIARAVYSQADIYILDDPLSAVDSHVGAHLFEKVVGPRGMLKDKARLLVTHGMHYLPKTDQIIVIKNGTISEAGPYAELMGQGGEFSRLVNEYALQKEEEEETPSDQALKSELVAPLPPSEKSLNVISQDLKVKGAPAGEIISKENAETGEVKMDVYRMYFGSMGLGPVLLLFSFYLFGQGAQIGMNVWLSYWSSQESNDDIELYIGVYALFGFVLSAFVVLQSIVTFVVCGIRAATTLHQGLLLNVLRAPMSFFDTTPLGRILNRFSKDQNTIDETLPRTFQSYFRTMFNVVGILMVISYSTFYFLVAIIPLGVIYFYIQRYYLATSRELKRLESVTRSPIYSHFSETLSGITTIRAYGLEETFIKENEKRLNTNQLAYYPTIASNRWLATRLEFVGSLVVLLSAMFAVIAFGTIDSATVGLSVTYALSITQTLNWMVRMSCDLEANIVSVERVKEYAQIKTEAPAIINENRPSETWPQKGVIEFRNYTTRYREGLDPVLKDIACAIQTSEKIGVVGRTGAGKSSLTLALFRLIEAVTGAIIVDGINISTIGLDDLRSRLTIIPQDPVLFSGTIRENLDPFHSFTDAQVWKALECAHLKEFVSSLEGKLESAVSQGGENLSVGQRQLVCLARALLRKTKILVLDEATAAVDMETDDLIQKTIRTEFQDCTIITIAHRINTILDNDRILVLDKGRISEFDRPQVLLADQASLFYSLAKQAGVI